MKRAYPDDLDSRFVSSIDVQHQPDRLSSPSSKCGHLRYWATPQKSGKKPLMPFKKWTPSVLLVSL